MLSSSHTCPLQSYFSQQLTSHDECIGPASFHDMRAVLAYAPNTSSEQAIMEAFRKSVSCPDDPVKKVSASRSFYSLFRQPLQTPECADQFACLGNPACSSHLCKTLHFHPGLPLPILHETL